MSVDFYRTQHSPINSSTSKQLYSFSRSQRFEPIRKSECKRSFYDCKVGAIDKRATTFGYGNKINFANNEGVPASGTYDRISQFSSNKSKNRGFKFGKDQNRNIIDNPQQLKRTPGPGSYISINQHHKTVYGNGFQNYAYSFRGKFEDPLERHKNELAPNHYQANESISARGDYFNTKYLNSRSPIFGKNGRFEMQKIETPGPGHYNQQKKANLNGTGTYFNTKYATTKANSFANETRPSPAKKNQAPDPGAYHQFSQFALVNKFNKKTK